MANRIQIRRDTAAAWAAANPVLAQGEMGIVTDVVPKQFKIGDGTTPWNSLVYVASGTMEVSSSTLDDLVDGTSYKRVQAAKADAINTSTIVAGTIWSSGNDGNGGLAPSPKGTHYTNVVQDNTKTLLVFFPSGVSATYLVRAHLQAGSAHLHYAFAIVQTAPDNTSALSFLSNGNSLYLSLSGLNLSVQQNTGITQTVDCVVQQITMY